MKIERICNFYVSKYHLGIILMEELRSKRTGEVITFFENGIENEINILKNKYKYNIEGTMDFNKTENIKGKTIKFDNDKIIIICGCNDYINKVNNYIKDQMMKNEINNNLSNKDKTIKILNCFNFETECKLMNNIMDKNEKILDTEGEKIIK